MLWPETKIKEVNLFEQEGIKDKNKNRFAIAGRDNIVPEHDIDEIIIHDTVIVVRMKDGKVLELSKYLLGSKSLANLEKGKLSDIDIDQIINSGEIVRFDDATIEKLLAAGIITDEQAAKLKKAKMIAGILTSGNPFIEARKNINDLTLADIDELLRAGLITEEEAAKLRAMLNKENTLAKSLAENRQLTDSDVDKVVQNEENIGEKLGEKLVEKGVLSQADANKIEKLEGLSEYQKALAYLNLLYTRGLISPAQLQRLKDYLAAKEDARKQKIMAVKKAKMAKEKAKSKKKLAKQKEKVTSKNKKEESNGPIKNAGAGFFNEIGFLDGSAEGSSQAEIVQDENNLILNKNKLYSAYIKTGATFENSTQIVAILSSDVPNILKSGDQIYGICQYNPSTQKADIVFRKALVDGSFLDIQAIAFELDNTAGILCQVDEQRLKNTGSKILNTGTKLASGALAVATQGLTSGLESDYAQNTNNSVTITVPANKSIKIMFK